MSHEGYYPLGHYYSPVPDLEALQRDLPRLYPAMLPEALAGINLNAQVQLEMLSKIKTFMPEMPFTEHKKEGLRFYLENDFYHHTDAFSSMVCYDI